VYRLAVRGTVGVAALLAALTGSAAWSAPAGAATTAGSLYRHSIAAVKVQSSVHYESRAAAPGRTVVIVADAGTTEGVRSVTVSTRGVAGHVMTLLTGNTAYVRGDAAGLTGFLGFPKPTAKRYAGRWLAIPAGSGGFGPATEGVTIVTLLGEMEMAGPYTASGPVSAGGVATHAVHGRVPASLGAGAGPETLFVPVSGRPLPVAQTAQVHQGPTHYGLTVSYSNWGEPVHVSAPSGAIPISRAVG